MLFGPRIEVKSKDINEAYKEFEKNMDIIILCADEEKWFDERHIMDAQCFPLRIIERDAKKYLEKDAIYYVYANKKGTSYEAVRKLLKQGFNAYDLGSIVEFKGPEEGINIKNRKYKRRK